MAVRTGYRRSGAAVLYAITGLVVGIIVFGIILVLVGANQHNMLVDLVLDIGRWLTTPFHDLFLRPNSTERLVVNWGIAALVYLAIGGLLARLARW
jgi:hypothetical protein